jgi:Uma2 family endonuclease
MQWSDVLNDPLLHDLPYKIELNEYGNIVMSPASHRHNKLQSEILRLISRFTPSGVAFVECSVHTTKGVRVADVAWLSEAFEDHHGDTTPYEVAPEICVEVISPSNSTKELEEKKSLYLAAGAQEVWFCDDQRKVSFHTAAGEIEQSKLIPQFPAEI